MSDQRFDLSYAGLLAPGADPDLARQHLAAAFKLSEQGVERLFTGQPVIVKRDVDEATASKFKKVFAQAGAILTITAVAGPDVVVEEPTDAPPAPRPQASGSDTANLALAPVGGVLEQPPEAEPPPLNTSYLSLVDGQGWTLEDCEPLPTPIPEPDISYLSLAPADTDDHTQPIPDATQ
ncbi:hypothetical protein [uncultured Thiodictyon sp.]|uniref:hypothetical protein n=1 Tax=uncultured Thiodictyon sp. TaxID=1846217 RepID=UPI0025D912EF|nr:hypothetical protein [uncultured Thiodictyon sp.]